MSASLQLDESRTGTTPPPRRTPRLAAYGLWQLRDYLMDRGAPTFIIAVLYGYLTIFPMLEKLRLNAANPDPRRVAMVGAEMARFEVFDSFNSMFLRSFVGALVFLGALFAMNGIVANDRKLGFYRFLFAKPVAPPRYYGQAFVIHWAGFLLVMALLALVYGAAVAPIMSAALFTVLAIGFLFYSGIAFALSAAARWDWLSLVTVTVGSTFLWERFGESANPMAALLYLLPPVHKTAAVYDALARHRPLPTDALLWLGGYGVAAFVIGLIVLRYRRLAIV